MTRARNKTQTQATRKIYVLHENEAWVDPLRQVFAEFDLESEFWFVNEGVVPVTSAPPEGIFYNRVGASAHTRGNPHAARFATLTLNWLERHGRRVVNNAHALSLELSKLAQYEALEKAGVRTPRTIPAVGRNFILAAARELGPGPWIIKPDRGGKGLDVVSFNTEAKLTAWLDGPNYNEPPDGVWLVQEYIQSPEPYIVRCEFVGGKFLYAMKVNTSEGFELCPAEGCSLADRSAKFKLIHDYDHHPITRRLEQFMARNQVDIAGIELIRDAQGRIYVYDVNTNTNYNASAESAASRPKAGMRAVASYLEGLLAETDAGQRIFPRRLSA